MKREFVSKSHRTGFFAVWKRAGARSIRAPTATFVNGALIPDAATVVIKGDMTGSDEKSQPFDSPGCPAT